MASEGSNHIFFSYALTLELPISWKNVTLPIDIMGIFMLYENINIRAIHE